MSPLEFLDKLDLLIEEERWEDWEKSTLAQQNVDYEEPYSETDEDCNLSISSDESDDRNFGR